jgi:hypothetical protein
MLLNLQVPAMVWNLNSLFIVGFVFQNGYNIQIMKFGLGPS